MEFTTPPTRPTPNMLFYGPGKTGKSIGAATAPGKVLYANLDQGNATRQVHVRNPDRIFEPKLPPYEKGAHPVFDLMSEISQLVNDPERAPDAVVIDPIGELHRRLLEEASSKAVRPALNAYGDVSTYVERFVRHLCESPVTTVIVAHDHPVKDEATGEIERLPWTGTSNPALGQKIIGMVDIVGYTGVLPPATEGEKEQYVVQLRSLKGRRGGDRFSVLEPIENVNIAEWIERIQLAEQSTLNAEPEEAKAA